MKFFGILLFLLFCLSGSGQIYLLDSTYLEWGIHNDLAKAYYIYNANEELIEVKSSFGGTTHISYPAPNVKEEQYFSNINEDYPLRREVSILDELGRIISRKRFVNTYGLDQLKGLDTFRYQDNGDYLYRSSYSVKDNDEAQLSNRYQAYINDYGKIDSSTMSTYNSTGLLFTSRRTKIVYDESHNPLMEIELKSDSEGESIDTISYLYSKGSELFRSTQVYYENDTLRSSHVKQYKYFADRIEIMEFDKYRGEAERIKLRHIFPSTQILTDLDSMILYGDPATGSEFLYKRVFRVDSSNLQAIHKTEQRFHSYIDNGLLPSSLSEYFYHKNRLLFEYEVEGTEINFTPYPNPMESDSYIIVIADRPYDYYEIYDATGRIIRNSSVEMSKKSLIQSPLLSGIYFLKLINTNTKESGTRQIAVVQ